MSVLTKRSYCTVQLRRGATRGDPWVAAAKRVLSDHWLRDSLFKHYKALVDLATNYNTMERSGCWRKDQGYIGAEVSTQTPFVQSKCLCVGVQFTC